MAESLVRPGLTSDDQNLGTPVCTIQTQDLAKMPQYVRYFRVQPWQYN